MDVTVSRKVLVDVISALSETGDTEYWELINDLKNIIEDFDKEQESILDEEGVATYDLSN